MFVLVIIAMAHVKLDILEIFYPFAKGHLLGNEVVLGLIGATE